MPADEASIRPGCLRCWQCESAAAAVQACSDRPCMPAAVAGSGSSVRATKWFGFGADAAAMSRSSTAESHCSRTSSAAHSWPLRR